MNNIQWRSNLEEAIKEAEHSKKLLLIDLFNPT